MTTQMRITAVCEPSWCALKHWPSLMRANGLVVSQLPEDINGQHPLGPRLLHISEHVSAVMLLPINNGKNGTHEWGKAAPIPDATRFCLFWALCMDIV